MFEHVLGCVQVVNSASSPGCQAGRWGTVVERLAGRLAPYDGASRFTTKTATVKKAPGKNGDGRNGNRKIGQLEKSATKNERVGKQGNTKLMYEITASEKRHGKLENCATGKLGNEN